MQGSSAHTKFDFSYHIVFVPKRRRKILGGARSEYLDKCFRAVAKKIGVEFDTLKIADDHVHMLAMIPPTISISTAMQKLKGLTAYLMLKEYSELRMELPEGTFWARGYYARTVGTLNEQLVRDYVNRTDHF